MTVPPARTDTARWAARLVLECRLDLIDAQLAVASLAALEGMAAAAGVEALAELGQRSGLHRVEPVLTTWLQARASGP
jgi:hypothetical protein